MKCGICQRGGLRRTTTVHAPGTDGVLKRVRACARCASRGFLVVPVSVASTCACGAVATKCEHCVEKSAAADLSLILAPFVKRLRGLAAGYAKAPLYHPETAGRVEGLAQAADMLEEGKV